MLLMLLIEVITGTLMSSYRYESMGYTKLRGVEFDTSYTVTIAVVDTGISGFTHSDIYQQVELMEDTTQNSYQSQRFTRGELHASMVLRSIIDKDSALPGTCFISSCHVHLYRALNDDVGTGYSIALALAKACMSDEVHVVNLSLGSAKVGNIWIDFAVRACSLRGKLVVAASGNEGLDAQVAHPCYLHFVLCVSGSLSSKERNPVSNVSSDVDVYAPSKYYRLSDGTTSSGTSGATALVSGLAALVWSQYPHLLARDVREIVTLSSVETVPGVNIVNVYEALELAKSY